MDGEDKVMPLAEKQKFFEPGEARESGAASGRILRVGWRQLSKREPPNFFDPSPLRNSTRT